MGVGPFLNVARSVAHYLAQMQISRKFGSGVFSALSPTHGITDEQRGSAKFKLAYQDMLTPVDCTRIRACALLLTKLRTSSTSWRPAQRITRHSPPDFDMIPQLVTILGAWRQFMLDMHCPNRGQSRRMVIESSARPRCWRSCRT